MSYLVVGDIPTVGAADAQRRAAAAKAKRDAEAAEKQRLARKNDWRTGSADTEQKRLARERVAAMEERRIGRPDLFVGDRPEMVARREAAEQQRLEMEGGAATGGIPTTYLLIGGAALVGLIVFMKKRKK